MTTPILRDPVTGRFITSKLKKEEPVVHLAYTVIYVVCFCTFVQMITLGLFYLEVHNLEQEVIANREVVKEIQDSGAALIIVPEMPESEVEIFPASPAGELDGAPEPEPTAAEKEPESVIRIYRGADVEEINL